MQHPPLFWFPTLVTATALVSGALASRKLHAKTDLSLNVVSGATVTDNFFRLPDPTTQVSLFIAPQLQYIIDTQRLILTTQLSSPYRYFLIEEFGDRPGEKTPLNGTSGVGQLTLNPVLKLTYKPTNHHTFQGIENLQYLPNRYTVSENPPELGALTPGVTVSLQVPVSQYTNELKGQYAYDGQRNQLKIQYGLTHSRYVFEDPAATIFLPNTVTHATRVEWGQTFFKDQYMPSLALTGSWTLTDTAEPQRPTDYMVSTLSLQNRLAFWRNTTVFVSVGLSYLQLGVDPSNPTDPTWNEIYTLQHMTTFARRRFTLTTTLSQSTGVLYVNNERSTTQSIGSDLQYIYKRPGLPLPIIPTFSLNYTRSALDEDTVEILYVTSAIQWYFSKKLGILFGYTYQRQLNAAIDFPQYTSNTLDIGVVHREF